MPQFLTTWLEAVEFTAWDVARCFVSFLSVPHGGQQARRVLVEEEETEEKEKSSCGGAVGVGDASLRMHRLHDVLQFFETSLKNRIVKN